ncbi:MAG: hypothetical protein HETSPECPRED_003080 [Heterodermia speciosa]|uniref:protein-ribulosamine 3-kinase n=1 Tax=Heterodermia speciosa TaxID=116794 RepID=A0A8H3F0J8_9LECA|nr:MAG: hypothetical protein HETSPECPRED_003080 [Heterodermia speciosa]
MATEFDGEVDVPETAIKIIDANVLGKLPQGTTGKSIVAHGASYWTRTARLLTSQADGSEKPYFLKVSIGQRGKEMMFGEYKSMVEINNAVPAFAPIPIAWGTYASNPDIHFFLCSFHEMSEELPDVQGLSARVAELHSKGKSPTGKYGFPCTTFQGNLPQDNRWTITWEEFYVNGMKRMLKLEEDCQGPSQELTELCVAMYEKVIPRLLRPLETGGRQIEPCLVHGDLWYGNASTDKATNQPLVFDACCFYAHNEYELGSWRPTRYKLGRPYVNAYHEHFPISAPVEDHDDRNALYSTRFNLHASAVYPGNIRFRNMIIDEMRRLVNKYPGGFEGWEQSQQQATGRSGSEHPPQVGSGVYGKNSRNF